MEYKIHWIVFGRATQGWTLEIDVQFPTQKQTTWEFHKFARSDTNLKPSKSIIWTFISFLWLMRKEIKQRQSIKKDI